MSSMYGRNIKISIFGQSHSEAVGVVIDGLPAGRRIDFEKLQEFMDRRAPGRDEYSTKRTEPDVPEFLSGLRDGATCGAPVSAVIRNVDARPLDYAEIKNTPRPGHADYTAHVKYGGFSDPRGGGHFSGRLTAPLCVAGGVCLQILENEGVEIAAHIAGVGGVADVPFDPVTIDADTLRRLRTKRFSVISDERGGKMREAIDAARLEGDSLGGVVECAAAGVPAGLGDPMFDGAENRIAAIVFGVPAVRGIEFGSGFGSALLRGSANNDAFYMDGGAVRTRTNNHGGVLGGITTGMPVLFRVAIKPTPSIEKLQDTVDLASGENVKLNITGRHDPCIVPRAVPCVESAAAIAILDMMREGSLKDKSFKQVFDPIRHK